MLYYQISFYFLSIDKTHRSHNTLHDFQIKSTNPDSHRRSISMYYIFFFICFREQTFRFNDPAKTNNRFIKTSRSITRNK